MLFVIENATLTCGSFTDHKYQAIKCGNLFVFDNANLYAANYNKFDSDQATVEVRHMF